MIGMQKETLLINFTTEEEMSEWQGYFTEQLPDLEVRHWHDANVDPLQVDYALVWKPEPGKLATFPNLKVIMSQAAGMEHILSDKSVPTDIALTRMVTDETSERMADYVTMAAYASLRRLPDLMQAQRVAQWKNHLTGRRASETTIGIMGLGQLGSAVATRLVANGFLVRGWSRSDKQIAGVQAFTGHDSRDDFLDSCDILVNLLPDTPETRSIIDADLLAKLPQGATLINVGRASQVNDVALLEALNEGQLGIAFLDVFTQEPLPTENPLWKHPNVVVTPHVASLISRRSKASMAIHIIKAARLGIALPLYYDRMQGY